MKKLVLASAVAALMASNTAMADTTFGGNIRLNLQLSDDQAAGETKLDSGKLTLDIKASEDLGNGMTGIARIEYENDNADNERTQFSNDLSYVGLKGDFGQVTAGVQDDAAGFACGATDIFTDNSGNTCGVGAANGPLDNAIVYANTFDAVTLVVGMTFDGDLGTPGTSDAGQPFGVQGNHTVLGVNFDGGAFTVGGQITAPDSDLDADDLMVIGGSVKLGEGTLGLTFADNGGDDMSDAIAVAFAMPLAGGKVMIGMDVGEALENAAGDDSILNLEYKKSLSKAVYTGVQYSADDRRDDDLIQAYMGYKF